jgi:hypothetical protein
MSATGSIRYIGKKPSSSEVKERTYIIGTEVAPQSSPVSIILPDNYGTSYVEVVLNGVKLDASDFTASTGSDLTFTSGIDLVADDVLVIRSFDFATTPRVNPIIQIKETIGPTGTQPIGTTHFDVAFTSTLDEVLIYKNGILLNSDQFTLDTSANSVDLTSTTSDGDEINIVVYGATKVVGSAEAVTQTYIDNEIATQKTDLETQINAKTPNTTFNTEVARLDSEISVLDANKVEQTYVDNAVTGLATESYVVNAVTSSTFDAETIVLDIESPNISTTSIEPSMLPPDNVVWYSNDGNLVGSGGSDAGFVSNRNIGELNNYFQVTKLGDLLYVDCKFALMDVEEMTSGTGFNTTELTEGKAETDPSERWSTTFAPSSTTNGISLDLSESHEMMPFHVEEVGGQKCIVPHIPYVNDGQTIHITGMPWGNGDPKPLIYDTDWNTNKYLRIHDWRSNPAVYTLNFQGTSTQGWGTAPAYTMTQVSGTVFDIDALEMDPMAIYHFRYFIDGWSDPSGYFLSATDNGYGPAQNLKFAQRGSRISCQAKLAKYKLCTLPAGYRPISDVEVSINSKVRKADFSGGNATIQAILEIALSDAYRPNKAWGEIFQPYTHNTDIETALNAGHWFGDWDTRKADTELLFALAYGYKNNSVTSGYSTGYVDDTLGGDGSFHPGLSGNWEYHTTSNSSTLGTAYQSPHFADASESYRYFVPHPYWADTFKPYGFGVKWHSLYPHDEDYVFGNKLVIKSTGEVLLYGRSGDKYFNMGVGPLFYNSKRTAFFGASFKTEISLV